MILERPNIINKLLNKAKKCQNLTHALLDPFVSQ